MGFLLARFWIDISERPIVVRIRQSSCLLNFFVGTLQPDHYAESDGEAILVTKKGVTIPFLLLQATFQRLKFNQLGV